MLNYPNEMETANPRRLWTFRLLAAALGILVALLALELLAAAILYSRDQRYIPAKQRFAASTNTFLTQVTANGADCRYIDTLFPHPYVAFVHHGNPPCGNPDINNVGLFGENFSSERRADRFVVLSTGGSVAAQMGATMPDKPRYLEEVLNRKYLSPNGKPFLVLNGADGAWKQPQQLILFLLYADAVDAVVTLDGFNEHYQLDSFLRFEYPANNFARANPLAERDFSGVVRLWMLGKVAALFRSSAILSRSNAAYLITQYLQNSTAVEQNRHTSVESLFALPPEWDKDKRFQWAIGQYEKYILAMNAVAAQQNVLASYFIQPAPAIGKPLTEKERAAVGDLSYGPLYQRMADALLQLRSRGVAIHSLLDTFATSNETLYADPIHMDQSAPGGSPGYRRMAERMAEQIAADWKLRPKP